MTSRFIKIKEEDDNMTQRHQKRTDPALLKKCSTTLEERQTELKAEIEKTIGLEGLIKVTQCGKSLLENFENKHISTQKAIVSDVLGPIATHPIISAYNNIRDSDLRFTGEKKQEQDKTRATLVCELDNVYNIFTKYVEEYFKDIHQHRTAEQQKEWLKLTQIVIESLAQFKIIVNFLPEWTGEVVEEFETELNACEVLLNIASKKKEEAKAEILKAEKLKQKV